MPARVQPGQVHVCRSRSVVSPLLTLLHAPRFHREQRRCPASFVARPRRRAVGMGDALPMPSPFAAVVASFIVSVWLPTLSKDGFGVQLAKDLVAVSFMAFPAIGSERDDLAGFFSSDVDLRSDFLFLSCLEPALEEGGEPMKTPSLADTESRCLSKGSFPLTCRISDAHLRTSNSHAFLISAEDLLERRDPVTLTKNRRTGINRPRKSSRSEKDSDTCCFSIQPTTMQRQSANSRMHECLLLPLAS